MSVLQRRALCTALPVALAIFASFVLARPASARELPPGPPDVFPEGGTVTVTADTTTRSVTFGVQNTGSSVGWYRMTCAVDGIVVSWCSAGPDSVQIQGGVSVNVVVSYRAAVAGSGEVRLTATYSASGSADTGHFYVTAQAPPAAPDVFPEGGTVTVLADTTHKSATFGVQNTGSTPAWYRLSCGVDGVVASSCGGAPDSIQIQGHASSGVTVSYQTAVAGSGEVRLTATYVGDGTADTGHFFITANPAPGWPDVSPEGGTVSVTSDSAPKSVTFGVQNTGGAAGWYSLECSWSGVVASCATTDSVQIAAQASVNPVVTYTTSGPGSGEVRLTARLRSDGSADTGRFYVTAEGTAAVAVLPQDSLYMYARWNRPQTLTGFRVKNTGTGRGVFELACTYPAPYVTSCEASPQSIELEAGDSTAASLSFVTGDFGYSVGTRLALTAETGSLTAESSAQLELRSSLILVAPLSSSPKTVALNQFAQDTFLVTNQGPVADTVRLTCTNTSWELCLYGVDTTRYVGPGRTDTVVVGFPTNQAGTQTITLTATGDLGGAGQASHTVSVGGATTGVAVATSIYGGVTTVGPSASTRTLDFVVTNTSTGTGSDDVQLSCGRTGAVDPCSVPSVVSLIRGSPTPVAVQYVAASLGSGTVTLTATLGSQTASATYTVNVQAVNPGAPSIAIKELNPDSLVARSACLTTGAGPGAANQCGSLLITHSMPAYRSMSRDRSLTLVYNSSTAKPYPVIMADVMLPADVPAPGSLQVELGVRRGGQLLRTLTYTFSGGELVPGGPARRLAVGYDASSDSTGVYPYVLTLMSLYDGAVDSTRIVRDSGEVLLVNTSRSPYGAGWSVAGVEQLYVQPDSSLLLVEGDGSAAHYGRSTGALRWIAPTGAYRDTITYAAVNEAGISGSFYIRRLFDGTRVLYNPIGKEKWVLDRSGNLAHKVEYTYFPSNPGSGGSTGDAVPQAPLEQIRVAPYGADRRYTLTYTDPFCQGEACALDRITDPAGRVLDIGLDASKRLQTIQDPGFAADSAVVFGYSGNLVTSRRSQRGVGAAASSFTTEYEYLSGTSFLTKVTLPPRDPVRADFTRGTIDFRPVQQVGLGATTVRTDSATFRMDGARVDVVDVAEFSLDRYGAPTRIVDPEGHVTTLLRGDVRFPLLATEVQYPVLADGRQRVQRATYDDFGSLSTLTEVDPYGRGSPAGDAVTQYRREHPVWRDVVTSIVYPEGNTVSIGYDDATGERIWQQIGPDLTRRVSFYYGDSNGLLTSVRYPNATRDSLAYDEVGNLVVAISPGGNRTNHWPDAAGRDTLVETPVNSPNTLFQKKFVRYDPRNLVLRDSTVGPPLNGLAEEAAVVVSLYDAEGNLQRLDRRSVPDAAGIRTMTTSWRLDWAGRRLQEFAPDNRVDETRYDLAGNADTLVTRRLSTITTAYDALNRPTTQALPTVSYSVESAGGWTFPLYGASGLTIPQETRTFAYDALGNMVRADNGSALVRRDYFLNGLVRSETQKINTWAADDTTAHVYTLAYEYDLNGRRTRLHHPQQLAPRLAGPLTDVSYGYDPATGLLASVTDVLGENFGYHYDTLLRLDSLSMPGGVFDRRTYDPDGRLWTRYEWGPSYQSAVGQSPPGVLHADTLSYDARGKVVQAVSLADSSTSTYAGLGALSTYFRQSLPLSAPTAVEGRLVETYTSDALGNTMAHTVNASLDAESESAQDYEPGTGRLLRTRTTLGQAVQDSTLYDEAGNVHILHRVRPAVTLSIEGESRPLVDVITDDILDYYEPDGRLRVSDHRTNATAEYFPTEQLGTFDTYRYDALGRRVLVRSQRDAAGAPEQSAIQRFVWDGDQILYEIRYPGGDTASVATLEQDTGYVMSIAPCSPTHDPNCGLGGTEGGGELSTDTTYSPFWGRVAYTHGTGIDHPLSLVRIGFGQDSVALEPFEVIPHTNWRGLHDLGTWPGGTGDYTQHLGASIKIEWPGQDMRSYLEHRTNRNPQTWMGSLAAEKQDASGLVYLRNRYYDPVSGRFTQEDPIGFAGGMNLYGYAGNDPVTYTDPFGLAPCPPDDDCAALSAALATTGFFVGGFGGGLFGGAVGLTCGPASPVCSTAGAISFSAQGAALGASAGLALGSMFFAQKPSSASRMQTEVRRGQAPRGVKRVDPGNPNDPGDAEPHVHLDDGRALKQGGQWKHGSGEITRAIADWLQSHGWGTPQ